MKEGVEEFSHSRGGEERKPRRRRRRDSTSREVDSLLERLHVTDGPAVQYVRELIGTAIRLLEDDISIGDVKLINAAARELRYAFSVFEPYHGVPKVTIFGSARMAPNDPVYLQARTFAEKIAARGYMLITGAGPGVMQACQEGSGRDGSFGLNIRLPFEQNANEIIDGDRKLVTFRYFFTRKLMFLKEADALTLFPGGFGTYDETFECLTLVQTGKAPLIPIVMLDAPGGRHWAEWKEYVETHLLDRGLISKEDLHLFLVTDDVDRAVEEITRFYRIYHSQRYVGENLVIRMKTQPDRSILGELHDRFGDILASGDFVLSTALPEEYGDGTEDLPRLVFHFNRTDYGRLRQLVDFLNQQ